MDIWNAHMHILKVQTYLECANRYLDCTNEYLNVQTVTYKL